MFLPAHTPLRRYIGRMVTTGASRPALRRYGIAIVFPGVALALTASLFSLDHAPFFLFFVFAVMFAALSGGRRHIAGVVLVFRDVTRERQSQAALIRAEKLASVGRLAASISHEVNNPLAAVSNLLYLIGTAPDLPAARSYAETAQSELARASYVTKQTLSFARRDEQREPVQLSELINGVLALYSNKLSGNAIQVVSRNRDHAIARANSNEAKQVIANLIANALDASQKGGKLHLRVTTSTWKGNPRVRMTVADTGTGISTEHMREIFEPFFSTKGNTGTGLGLWVTREIVHAHGGCIHIRSRVGKGTVVIVCWPAMAAMCEKGLHNNSPCRDEKLPLRPSDEQAGT
jgi:signal transduction histidine kinase